MYVKKELEHLLNNQAQSYLNNASNFLPNKEPRPKKCRNVEMVHSTPLQATAVNHIMNL
jgi:hypothetical protein